MASVVPTVTAYSAQEYKTQIETAAALSNHISLDFMDGVFTPAKNINLVQAYWPPHIRVDIHLMYEKPAEHVETLISMKPNLVVLHAESGSDLKLIFNQLSQVDIRTGLAFLPASRPADFSELLKDATQALIFSGKLGSFGGVADMSLLGKVASLRAINPKLEIAWDGGVNDKNAKELVAGGVDFLNVGGYLQNARDPQIAYAKLEAIASGVRG